MWYQAASAACLIFDLLAVSLTGWSQPHSLFCRAFAPCFADIRLPGLQNSPGVSGNEMVQDVPMVLVDPEWF